MKFFTVMLAVVSLFLSYSGLTFSADNSKDNTLPLGFTDLVSYKAGIFQAGGWAADKEDGSPVKKVEVYVDGKLVGTANLGIKRPDVIKNIANPNWGNSGWNIKVKISLNKGPHTAYAVAYDKNGVKAKLTNEKTLIVE